MNGIRIPIQIQTMKANKRRRRPMKRALKIGLTLTMALGGSVSAADWPQWRGPHGSGVSDERDLPVRWSATENLSWKVDLGGVGVSRPIFSRGDGVRDVADRRRSRPAGPASRAGGERGNRWRAGSGFVARRKRSNL